MKIIRSIYLLCPLCILFTVACVAPEPEMQVGVRVSHLTSSGPQAGLPSETDTLRFLVVDDTGEVIRDFSSSWAGLSDLDGDGASDREAAIEIPPNQPVSLMIHAKKNRNVLATARVDGLKVAAGARRYVDLTFTPIRTISTLSSALPSGRFAHAAAMVATDGRVLVTGGFVVGQASLCPPQLGVADICFDLTATDEAILIDPSDGTVYQTRANMLQPRALHTATSLGDGRVLIAGGVTGAVLGLERVEGVLGNFEYRTHIAPKPASGFEAVARTFEVFDPTLNMEEVDVGRDGDPESGGFIGAPAEPSIPGQLNVPRYLHAATLLPGSDSDVMLVGGQGSSESGVSVEVFRLDRPGGSGLEYPPTYFVDTTVNRSWPAAATTSSHVVVIGGGWPPTNSQQLLERWSSELGTFSTLADCPGWDYGERPKNAIVGASSVVFGRDVQRVLVTGWLGPMCAMPPDGAPATLEAFDGVIACSSNTYSSRSFTVGLDECSIGGLLDPEEAHFLGPAASMPNGQALISGGFSDGSLHVTSRVELLTGEFRATTNLALRDTGITLDLSRGRAWHTATTLYGGRVLFIGGMNFTYGVSATEPQGVDFSAAIDVYDPGFDPATASTGSGEEE